MLLAFAITAGWLLSALVVLIVLAIFIFIVRLIFPEIPARLWQLIYLLVFVLFLIWCIGGPAFIPIR
jgi:hypothetical protein